MSEMKCVISFVLKVITKKSLELIYLKVLYMKRKIILHDLKNFFCNINKEIKKY